MWLADYKHLLQQSSKNMAENNVEENNLILMKDLLLAIEKDDTIDIDSDTFNLHQVYGRIMRSITRKANAQIPDVKDLLLKDIEILAKLSYLNKNSQREILLALYDSLLTFASNVNNNNNSNVNGIS